MPELQNRIKFTSKDEVKKFLIKILEDIQNTRECVEKESADIERERQGKITREEQETQTYVLSNAGYVTLSSVGQTDFK